MTSVRRRRALITGVAGQDGIYLARLLSAEGIEVFGTTRPGSESAARRECYLDGVGLIEVDLRDAAGMAAVLDDVVPDEVYNLAALSSVASSWRDPELAAAVNADSVVVLLDAVVSLRDRVGRQVRLFQASSGEVLSDAAGSPYAVAKATAERAVVLAREQRGLFACYGVLFNHESPLRGRQFVTRKITRTAVEIALGHADRLRLGNLAVHRDWGHAADHVQGMREMLRTDTPVDLQIGTGVAHSLSELLEVAFAAAGLGPVSSYVEEDPALIRPIDAAHNVADPGPALATLGWQATTSFESLVEEMVKVDFMRVRSGVEEDPSYLTGLPDGPT